MSYEDYMKSIEQTNHQEYSFWRLYEKMQSYSEILFEKLLNVINYFEKPSFNSKNQFSQSTVKQAQNINATLRLMIDGMNEEVYNVIFDKFKIWLENSYEVGATIQISGLTAKIAQKNPEKANELVPLILDKVLN